MLCIACGRLGAQDYVISLRHWGIREGLPHRQINCIYQDRRGLIWLGTPYGLTRFDGYSFTTYLSPRTGSSYRDITSIAEDARGTLWLSCRGIGKTSNTYITFDPETDNEGTVQQATGKTPDMPAAAFCSLSDSSILVWQDDNTFYKWSGARHWDTITIPATYKIISVLHNEKVIIAINYRQELTRFDMHGRAVATAPSPFTREALDFSVSLRRFIDNHYLVDKVTNRTYYILSSLSVEDVTEKLPKLNPGGVDDVCNAGPDGITLRQGILFHPEKKLLRDFRKDGSMEFGGKSRAVIADNKGRMWIGTDFGLYQLSVSKNKFRQYFKDSSGIANYNSCRGMVVAGNKMYVNSQMKGMFLVDKSSGNIERAYYMSPTYNPSFAIAETMKGEIASYTRWTIRILDKDGRQHTYPIPGEHPNHCWTIYECDTNKFLFGREFGLTWFDLNTGIFAPFTQYNNYTSLARNNVIYINRDRNNNLWLCSSNGFYAYDPAKGITARYSSTDTGIYYLPASDIHHFCQDDSGIYWLSTTFGLVRWDRNRHTSQLFSRVNGLSNNNINAAYDDGLGNMWLSSDYGIMKFNKKTFTVKTYLAEDGLTYNEFNRSSHFRDDSGNIYFGSLNGVTAFNPRDFKNNLNAETSSPLVITSFQQFNGETNKLENRKASLLRNNAITLNPQDRFFLLEFALINYNDPVLNTYYWKIDGIDSEWNVQKDHTLRLSRLPYGSRLLHIKAQEPNGNWSSNELTIRLNVIMPVYMQAWFIMLAIAAGVFLIAGIYRWRIYLLKKENERLDAVVTEKTKDLQESLQQKKILLEEVHHRVKNNLQMISSLLELQSFRLVDEEAREAFQESQSRVTSIAIIHEKLYQNESFNSLDFRNFIDSLFAEIKKLSDRPLKEIELQNDFPSVFFNIDIAIPLGLILNELITNSIKHAKPVSGVLTIHIGLRKEGKHHVLIYKDNGQGLPGDFDIRNSKSLGMQLVHMQSLQLGGHAIYRFEKGSVFTIFFIND